MPPICPPPTTASRRACGRAGGRTAGGTAGALVLGLCLALAAAGCAAPASAGRLSALVSGGVAQNPCHPAVAVPIPPRLAGHYLPGSSVLVTGQGYLTGPGRVSPSSAALTRCAAAAAAADQAWLASGQVPGRTAGQRALAARALLDLDLAVQPDGAVVAGWHEAWEFSWPRDSSWVAAALADTGHSGQAYRILRFLQRVQPAGGVWAARYHLNGSGPVRDGRPAELDSVGWVPWAVWSWYTAEVRTSPATALAGLRRLWPMVSRAADAAAAALTGDGLPRASMDYWETSDGQQTIETAAALLLGLRSASYLAGAMQSVPSAGRWGTAAHRLTRAITSTFGRTGYQRTPAAGSGADAAVTFLGPPFEPSTPAIRSAITRTARTLRLPDGGMLPGSDWPGTPTIAWTPETAFFALSDYASNEPAAGTAIIDWLTAHRTAQGSLAEQVNRLGAPVSVAPLAWTDAIVLLALDAESPARAAGLAPPAGPLPY